MLAAVVLLPIVLTSEPAAPEPRTGAYMVYDTARGQTLLFGGWTRADAQSPIAYPADLWSWDGKRWRRLDPPSGTERPIGRDVPVMAFDAARKRLVMFGGRRRSDGASAGWESDVWEWDGTRWYRIAGANTPHVLHPTALYDAQRRRVVVYGGGLLSAAGAFTGFSRTLWEWDGVRWQAVDSNGPELPTAGATVTSGGELLFLTGTMGANRAAPAVASRLWSWTGSVWTDHAEGPPFNNLQAVAGAPDGSLFFYQAWEDWRTTPVLHIRDARGVWRHVEDASNPGIRNTQAAVWDARRQRFVLFGGATRDNKLLNDTWEFDGRHWSKR